MVEVGWEDSFRGAVVDDDVMWEETDFLVVGSEFDEEDERRRCGEGAGELLVVGVEAGVLMRGAGRTSLVREDEAEIEIPWASLRSASISSEPWVRSARIAALILLILYI